MTLTINEIISQIYSINSFYSKQKLMGPYFKGWIRSALEKSKIEFIEENDKIVAFMTFSILKKKPFITLQKLAVVESKMRNGYGKNLIDSLKKKANSINYAIQLRVASINRKAIEFYESQNFIIEDDGKHEYSIRMVWE